MTVLQAGNRVGEYVLIEPLGSGGASTVWRARRERDENERALKVLRRELVEAADTETGPTVIERFLREARIIQKLDHPGLIEIYEVIDDRARGVVAYAMELLAGEDLAASASSIDLFTLLDVHARAADTLAFLHGKGVIHRDVKPENIFLARDRVKLLDFGTAKELYATSRLGPTEAGVLLGTLRSMAPESFRIGSAPAAPVDQWGLGISLYSCLTGALPFDEISLSRLVSAIEKNAPPPMKLRPHFGRERAPPELEAIVARCLAKRPHERFASMEELAVELKRCRACASSPATSRG